MVARWLDSTPGPAWWGRTDQGGGQVIEQATHLYDLARLLMGEATVVGAASTTDILRSRRTGSDVVDSTAAVLRFDGGAIGSFANTRRLSSAIIEIEFISEGFLTTLDQATGARPGRLARPVRRRDDHPLDPAPGRDPYERQASAFLDAVEAGDPSRVLSSYADALKTDRLTRAVVAATGAPG